MFLALEGEMDKLLHTMFISFDRCRVISATGNVACKRVMKMIKYNPNKSS